MIIFLRTFYLFWQPQSLSSDEAALFGQAASEELQSYFTEVAKLSENTLLYEAASSRKPASFSESILSCYVA